MPDLGGFNQVPCSESKVVNALVEDLQSILNIDAINMYSNNENKELDEVALREAIHSGTLI